MLIPYRAKNPPERFPFVTIGLIIANTLIFVMTQDEGVISKEAMESYGLSHNTLSLLRLFTGMFLHGNWLHLIGNMLFLWIVGASLEGRLKPLRYIALYLVCGLTGALLHDVVDGIAHPDQFMIGASGAIMGLAGAYLFVFPFAKICIAWWFFYRAGIAEWEARWFVIFYIAQDLIFAMLFRGGDGVAHFAHLGGMAAGLTMVWAMRIRRDSEEISNVQAARADIKDYAYFSARELEPLVEQPTEDMNLIMSFCERAISSRSEKDRTEKILQLMNFYAVPIIEKVDPQRVAYVLLHLPIEAGGVPLVYYLRLASKLERVYSNDLASQLYRRAFDLAPAAPESETALFRLAQIMQNSFQNFQYATLVYQELMRLFPNGNLAFTAKVELDKIARQVNQSQRS